MRTLKSGMLSLIYRGWLGDLLRIFGSFLRTRKKVLGLTNPLYMSHAVCEHADGVCFTAIDSYVMSGSGRRKMIRFDPNSFEPEITFLIKTLVKSSDIVLDVGANIGYHSVTMAKAATNGHLYAFEPVPEMAEQHSINTRMNRLDNVTLFGFALGDKDEDLEMKVNIGGEGLQGTSTFIDDNYNVKNNPDCYETEIIRIRRLDAVVKELDLASPIRFIKIDTEGFDAMVLEGGLETLREHRPVIVVEAHSSRLKQAGKSWSWFLDTFPEYHILIIHSLHRANPYLNLQPLTPDQPEISVNLLMLPRNNPVD